MSSEFNFLSLNTKLHFQPQIDIESLLQFLKDNNIHAAFLQECGHYTPLLKQSNFSYYHQAPLDAPSNHSTAILLHNSLVPFLPAHKDTVRPTSVYIPHSIQNKNLPHDSLQFKSSLQLIDALLQLHQPTLLHILAERNTPNLHNHYPARILPRQKTD